MIGIFGTLTWKNLLVFALVLGFLAWSPTVSMAQEWSVPDQAEATLDGQSDEIEEGEEMGESESGDLSFEEFLNDDEIAAEGYAYDPGERRDPFKSLLAARQGPLLRGPRPRGIPGLLIDEIDLTGIFFTVEGPVAQIVSTEQENSFLLREGDQLYDGDVVSISLAEVVGL